MESEEFTSYFRARISLEDQGTEDEITVFITTAQKMRFLKKCSDAWDRLALRPTNTPIIYERPDESVDPLPEEVLPHAEEDE